jgi:hypothetical protein
MLKWLVVKTLMMFLTIWRNHSNNEVKNQAIRLLKHLVVLKCERPLVLVSEVALMLPNQRVVVNAKPDMPYKPACMRVGRMPV